MGVVILLTAMSLSLSRTASATALEGMAAKYPTDYPVERQTYEVGVQKTQAAYKQTAEVQLLTSPISHFIFLEATEVIVYVTPIGTQAGDGVISDQYMAPSKGILNAWFATIEGEAVAVYAGGDLDDVSVGLVGVSKSGLLRWHNTPANTGAVKIVDALAKRLILTSTHGTTFYFDVLSETFIDSLSVPDVK